MGDNTATEQHEKQVKKLLEDVNGILEKSIQNRDALSGLPPTKAQAIQSYVQGHKTKVEALINIYKSADRLAALEREKKANGWLKAATYMDLGRYSMEAIKSGAEAAVNAMAVRVAVSDPKFAKQLAAASEKITRFAGAPVAALGAISDAIQAIKALQSGDMEAYARSGSSAVSGAIQVGLFVVHRGFEGAAAGAAAAGAGVAFVITLYVEGVLAFGQLGGILKQIRVEREARGLQEIVRRAYAIAGFARSMFTNYEKTFPELLARSAPEATLVAEICEAEGRRIAGHLGSMTRRLKDDSKLSKEKFPKALIDRMWSASIPGITMTGQKRLIQEALHATAAYVALRLYELELVPQNTIQFHMFRLKNDWRL